MGFADDMKGVFSKGGAAARDLLSIAGDKAKELGEKGMVKIEILRIEADIQDALERLGQRASIAFFDEGQSSLSRDDAKVSPLLAQLRTLQGKLKERMGHYSTIGGNDEDLDK